MVLDQFQLLVESYGVTFSEPGTKRKEQVIIDIDARLKRLEEEGFDIKKLGENDEFLTISMQAYNIALRNSSS